jgi:hypothetical protein
MNKLLFILLLIPVIGLTQNTYYIDSTNGNDSNDGLSTSTPWKTISKVNDQTYNAGDKILFKRNEIWNGERLYIEDISGTVANNVTYSDYGNGEKPIISSIITQNHNWTYTSNNIWKATNPPTDHPERLLINGIEKLRANIISELDGINYFWFYDVNTNNLYIHTIEDPTNMDIAYSTDFPLIVGYSNNITIENIDFQGGWTAIYITTMSKNILLQNLNIGKYAREGIIISTDSTITVEFPENILIENCTVDAFFSFDYSNAGIYQDSFDRGSSDGIRAEVLLNSEIQNCYLKNWGHASISVSGEHISNIKVHHNYLTSPDICYGGRIAVDDATNVEIYNNEIINTSVQSQLNGQSNHYHHNIFYGTKDTPLVPSIIDSGIELQGYSESAVHNNIFENNIILNTEGPAFRISGNNDFNISNNTFRNNLIYNCGLATNGKSIVIEVNEFGLTYNNSFNNNLVYNENTTQTCDFRTTISNVTSFNTITSDGYQITNNIADNPLLVNVNNSNYHLTASSPCINSGTTILATFDFEGNPVPFNATAPDIGIYEYQNSLSTPEINQQQNIILYPNPSNNYIFINGIDLGKIKTIVITDIQGKVVLKNIPIQNFIATTTLNKGIYFIKITTLNDTNIVKKIILK